MVSLFTKRSTPSSNKIIGSNRWCKDLWKVSQTRFLYVEDFFSILLTASNIGKYPKSCLVCCDATLKYYQLINISDVVGFYPMYL